MNIKIVNPKAIVNRITEFYNNAKIEKFDNSYGWDEVRRDILLARRDTNFSPYNSSKQNWIRAGYNVVINKRGWAFAYLRLHSPKIVNAGAAYFRGNFAS